MGNWLSGKTEWLSGKTDIKYSRKEETRKMKSKKWLISLGLAVVLVVAFSIPACTGEPTEYWHTPGDVKIEFELASPPGELADIGSMIVTDLQDFGIDVTHQVIDRTTFVQYMYAPDQGGMDAFNYRILAGPDPWGDWVWAMVADPEGAGLYWSTTWYQDDRIDELYLLNYLAPNLTAKTEYLFEMQEILAEDLPFMYLVRPDFIHAHRTDEWTNWHNQLGGPIMWFNHWTFRDVEPVNNATRYCIGTLNMLPNLNMNAEALMYVCSGNMYLCINYENLSGYPKIDEDSLEANPNAPYEFYPMLATSYEFSYEDDGQGGQNQILTVQLREGVKWHDYDTEGKNLTADDVVFTIKYVTNKYDFLKPVNWTAVEENDGEILPEHMLVEATDTYTFEMTYIQDYHQATDICPNWWRWDPVVPKHIFEPPMLLDPGDPDHKDPWEWDGYSIGTGPFHLEEFVPDDYYYYERFDDYWGDGVEGWGLPAAQEVLYQKYADPGAVFLALENGDIDMHEEVGVPPSKIASYQADPNLEVEFVKGVPVHYVGFNLHPTAGYAPLQDEVFRQAVSYAIDKEHILEVVYGGYGEIPDSLLYSESARHNPDLPQYAYDLTEAESILLAAGYTKHA